MSESAPPFRWSRSRIGRGRSFPVGLTQVQEALATRPTPSLTSVFLWDSGTRDPARYFSEAWIPEPHGLDATNFLLLGGVSWQGIRGDSHAPPLSADLTIGAFESARKFEMRTRFVEEFLPAVLDWIATTDGGRDTRRTEKHRMAFYLRDDTFEIAEIRSA